jgi:hypothetical protein
MSRSTAFFLVGPAGASAAVGVLSTVAASTPQSQNGPPAPLMPGSVCGAAGASSGAM